MNFKERFFQKNTEPQIGNVHKDFRIKEGSWRYNRSFSEIIDRSVDLKVRFAFDDPTLLDSCPFHAKIGPNLDQSLGQKYIGFAYGNSKNKRDLLVWAQKFPYSELIEDLDSEGVFRAREMEGGHNQAERRASL